MEAVVSGGEEVLLPPTWEGFEMAIVSFIAAVIVSPAREEFEQYLEGTRRQKAVAIPRRKDSMRKASAAWVSSALPPMWEGGEWIGRFTLEMMAGYGLRLELFIMGGWPQGDGV